jgi:hypothetical protein
MRGQEAVDLKISVFWKDMDKRREEELRRKFYSEWISELYYVMLGIYRVPSHLGTTLSGEGWCIKNALARDEPLYVEHPAEKAIYTLLDKRLLVVRGPKGDGLSAATLMALTKKILYDDVIVVDPTATRRCLSDVARLQNVVHGIRSILKEPVFYLDLSKPGHYPRKPWSRFASYMPLPLDDLIGALEEVRAVAKNEEVAAVVVLSDDLYEILKHKLGEHATVEVSSNDTRLLKELVQTYSGCGEDAAAEVAEAAAKYDCGRAVLAVLAADWLMQRNCDRGAVAEALKAAEEKAKELYVEYIWRVVLNGDRPYANLHAPLILLRHFQGPVSTESAEEFLISLGFEEHKVRNSAAVRWLAVRHCGLIEGAVRKAVEMALTKKIKGDLPEALHSALRYYHDYFKSYLK